MPKSLLPKSPSMILIGKNFQLYKKRQIHNEGKSCVVKRNFFYVVYCVYLSFLYFCNETKPLSYEKHFRNVYIDFLWGDLCGCLRILYVEQWISSNVRL